MKTTTCIYCISETNFRSHITGEYVTYFFNTEIFSREEDLPKINLWLCKKHYEMLITFPTPQDREFFEYLIQQRKLVLNKVKQPEIPINIYNRNSICEIEDIISKFKEVYEIK